MTFGQIALYLNREGYGERHGNGGFKIKPGSGQHQLAVAAMKQERENEKNGVIRIPRLY